jgi:hypothetical protein
MNGDKFLLDTNAVLYILNGDETLIFYSRKNYIFL